MVVGKLQSPSSPIYFVFSSFEGTGMVGWELGSAWARMPSEYAVTTTHLPGLQQGPPQALVLRH